MEELNSPSKPIVKEIKEEPKKVVSQV